MLKRRTLIISLSVLLSVITPITLVVADDTIPPVITAITYGPQVGVRTSPSFSIYVTCRVTDNVAVADVRIRMTGPTGFTPVNVSMNHTGGDDRYTYTLYSVPVSGTYAFSIWAIDTSQNTNQSDTYQIIVVENYLSYVHVDDSNTAGPWDGTAAHPMQYVAHGVAMVAASGTVFVHQGVYHEYGINLPLYTFGTIRLIGEHPATTIIDGGHNPLANWIVKAYRNNHEEISNLTFQNQHYGLLLLMCENTTVSHCTFINCSLIGLYSPTSKQSMITNCTFLENTVGLQFIGTNTGSYLYHNNFIGNQAHVIYAGTSPINNTWNSSTTGNYWDDYRTKYPDANIQPTTGTWDTPYYVNGSDYDYHPWVYPEGYIDTVAPKITVLYPNGGEVVSGDITLQWTALDAWTPDLNGTILIEYSGDNGGAWETIADGLDNTGMYVWNTTMVPDGTTYLIRVSAQDEFLNVGSDVSDGPFAISNSGHQPPGLPLISGPSTAGKDILLNFTATTTDPNGEQIYYQWDWGDGNISDWLGPYNSGEPIITNHSWANYSSYEVLARAKDVNGSEGNWSKPHVISIASQLELSNIKRGYIYFRLFSINRSFFYSYFLDSLGVSAIVTNNELFVEVVGTDVVQRVTFEAIDILSGDNYTYQDDDSSGNFTCSMNISRGAYELLLTAYDGNNSVIDQQVYSAIVYLRIGRYSMLSSGQLRASRLWSHRFT
ncbi:MAG: right-handed parallel beta-helix repeat-containing protein [Candidatus Thermoplasmatota archaeon]|nr:right-handed parallel beta-helix repeat-containing protein [Candidatus Thermoplasmatota archaeon]